jgi:hypothetical protein
MPLAQGGSARQMASNGTGAGAGAPTRLAATTERLEISNKRRPTAARLVGHACGAAAPAACLMMLSLEAAAADRPRVAGPALQS